MILVEDEILASRTTVADRLGETAGQSHPLGATLVPGGANFSIFSRSALGIDLLFFDRHDDPRPSRVIPSISPPTGPTTMGTYSSPKFKLAKSAAGLKGDDTPNAMKSVAVDPQTET
jgi:pullulanase/glycogen debranching enzyme